MLVAASALARLLSLLLVLACPLMMIFMMRGMHRHGGSAPPRRDLSLDDLERERDELDEEIGKRTERTVIP